jgi:hypothetical protein
MAAGLISRSKETEEIVIGTATATAIVIMMDIAATTTVMARDK